jgi:hypothetical protein
MKDVIQLTAAPVVVLAGGTNKVQPVEQAMDVGGYDAIDLAIDTLGGGPSSVVILTSMALHSSDSDWVEAGSILPIAPATSIPDNTANQVLTIPANGKTLFRFIRWKLTPGTTSGATNITGLARRA